MDTIETIGVKFSQLKGHVKAFEIACDAKTASSRHKPSGAGQGRANSLKLVFIQLPLVVLLLGLVRSPDGLRSSGPEEVGGAPRAVHVVAPSVLLNLGVALGAAADHVGIPDHPAGKASLHHLHVRSEEELSMDSTLKGYLFLESLKEAPGGTNELNERLGGNDGPAEESWAEDAFLFLHPEAQDIILITL
jgi:hypothetical protein